MEKYRKEMEDEKDRLIRRYDQSTKPFEKKVDGLRTCFKIVQAKLENEVITVKNELQILCAKYEMGEARSEGSSGQTSGKAQLEAQRDYGLRLE